MQRLCAAVFVLILVAVTAPAVLAQTAQAAAGEKLYVEQKCSMCHSIAGKGNAKGPLDDVGSRLSEEDLRQWLVNPKVMMEKAKATRKPAMPSYAKLTKEQVESLVSYLETLKKK